jgi:hypothetical protein
VTPGAIVTEPDSKRPLRLFRPRSSRRRDLSDAGVTVDDHFADADGELLKIIRFRGDQEPAIVFLSGSASGVGAEAGHFGFQGFVAFVEGDPDPVHLGLVAAVAKHEEELLTGIDREHPEEGADLRLDREKIVENKVEWYFAVHGMNLIGERAPDLLNIC